jgi:lactate dehydrogenase-like 2-hydroxyacid dehydrogenase
LKNGERGVVIHGVEKSDGKSMIDAANTVRPKASFVIYEGGEKEDIRSVPTLKAVSIPSVGYNNIDVKRRKSMCLRERTCRGTASKR